MSKTHRSLIAVELRRISAFYTTRGPMCARDATRRGIPTARTPAKRSGGQILEAIHTIDTLEIISIKPASFHHKHISFPRPENTKKHKISRAGNGVDGGRSSGVIAEPKTLLRTGGGR